MGNCLVIQDKEVKIMRVDVSNVLKTPSPPLNDVDRDALAEPLITGKRFVPAGSVLPAKTAAVVGADQGRSTVRVKLVVRKRELRRLLGKEGVSLDDMLSAMRKEAVEDRESEQRQFWRPALESIPEGSDF